MKSYVPITGIPTTPYNTSLSSTTFSLASHYTLHQPNYLTFPFPIIATSTSHYTFIITPEYLYQASIKILKKLKLNKVPLFVLSNTKYVIVINYSFMDVYYLTKNPYFVLKARFKLTSKPTNAFFVNDLVFVCCGCAVYGFDIEEGKVCMVASFMQDVLGVFVVNDELVCVCKDCVYYFKFKIVDFESENGKTGDDEMCNEEDKSDNVNKDLIDENNERKGDCYNNEEVNVKNENVNKLYKNMETIDGFLPKFIYKVKEQKFLETKLTLKITQPNIFSCCQSQNTIFLAVKETKAIEEVEEAKESTCIYKLENKAITETDYLCQDIKSIKSNKNILLLEYEDSITTIDLLRNQKDVIYIPTILAFSTFKNLIAIASENYILIYKFTNNTLTLKREFKLDNPTRIKYIKFNSSILVTISILGTVKLIDINSFYTFRTFDLPFNVLSFEADDDFSLLFFGSTNSVFVYDAKRKCQIDELQGHTGFVSKLRLKGQYLFSLGFDNFIRREYIYDSKRESLEYTSTKTILDFVIGSHIYVLTTSEVTILDFEFNFVKTFTIDIQPRFLAVNDLVFVYGHFKDSVINVYTMDGLKVQEIKVGKVQSMISLFNCLVVNTNTEFLVYGHQVKKFEPIDLEVDITADKALQFLAEGNFCFALVAAIKLNDFELIEKVVKTIDVKSIESIVKVLDEKYVKVLIEKLERMQFEGKYSWVRVLSVYGDCKVEVDEEAVRLMRMNYLMIKYLKEKKK